jgi:hypothetical protein
MHKLRALRGDLMTTAALIGGTNPEANNEADRQEYQAYDFHCSYRSKLRDRSKEKGPGDGDGLALTTAKEGGRPSRGSRGC